LVNRVDCARQVVVVVARQDSESREGFVVGADPPQGVQPRWGGVCDDVRIAGVRLAFSGTQVGAFSGTQVGDPSHCRPGK